MNFKTNYDAKVKQIDTYIASVLSSLKNVNTTLLEAMRYSVLNGGKRIRSVLCTEIAVMLQGDYQKAIPFAASIEFIHAYSLVHDDLPAMDNADYRRGQLSCHKKYGEALGILCGDALLNLSYEHMTAQCIHNGFESIQAMNIIASCAGVSGMVNGQAEDLEISSSPIVSAQRLTALVEQKTMALFKAAVLSGAYLASATLENIKQLEAYAYHLGIAFQIRDDFEDLDEDVESAQNSPNFINALGESKAREEMDYHSKMAHEIISSFQNSDFLVRLQEFLFQ